MEFVLILRELAGRWRIVAIGAAVALVVAVFSVYRLDGFGLKPRSLVHSSASTQVLVDSESSVLGNVEQSFEPLASRATVYANFMTSPAVLNVIAHRVGLSGEQLYAAGPVSLDEPRVEQEPTALKRNVQITGETKPYRLGFESQTNLPTITINTQAPTTAKAVALANAAAVGMEEYVWGSENTNNVPAGSRVIVRQLGPAHGAVDDPSIRKSMLALVFVAILLLWCAAMLIVPRLRRVWRESAAVEGLVGGASASGDPAAAPANGAVSANGATAAYEVASGNGATTASQRSHGGRDRRPGLQRGPRAGPRQRRHAGRDRRPGLQRRPRARARRRL